MFLKRKTPPGDIREGGVYQFERDGRVVEVAKVVSLYDDRDGIPHVRYELGYQRADRVDFEGTRVLALRTFAERYQPPAGE